MVAEIPSKSNFGQDRILLGLLDSVERDGGQSQRRLASELGIALGLVNAYLKRCVKKGLLKASQAPARRYVYYLTPKGFAEKSRLTVEYLSYSMSFFRKAKDDCTALLKAAQERGLSRIVLLGKSDLAEITVICALDRGIRVVALVDPKAAGERFVGFEIVGSLEAVTEEWDVLIVTDMLTAKDTYIAAVNRFGTGRVLVPAVLRVTGPRQDDEAAA